MRRRLILGGVAAVGIVGALGVALAWTVGSQLVAPVNRPVGRLPEGVRGTDVTFEAERGRVLSGWWLPSGKQPLGGVVLAHPIRADRRVMLERARLFQGEGLVALLFDFGGHGESPAEALGLGWTESGDVRAAVGFLRQRHPGLAVVVVGWSLGGAAAVLADPPLAIQGLVLEAVYPTLERAVQNRTGHALGPLGPLAAWCLLAQVEPRLGVPAARLAPVEVIPALDLPVLILNGARDWRSTPADAQRLWRAARQAEPLMIVEGAGHHDLYRAAPQRYRSTVVPFVLRCVGAGP